MCRRIWPLAVVSAFGLFAHADDTTPVKLSLEPSQSVYALPTPPSENEGINQGGVNVYITVKYLTDNIYRGVDRTAFIQQATRAEQKDRANFQFDGKLDFNLGKLPHPFIGIFANVLDADPVSNFQEVRPLFGAEWRIRPVILAAGNNAYIFPDRDFLNTSEAWGKITLDDAAILQRPEALISPYIYTAYDYDRYNGWYFEMGISHDFVIEGTPITLTAVADVAYVLGNGAYALRVDSSGDALGQDSGWQHYELGLIGRYNLNVLLNIPKRYGSWSLNGYLYYTDGLNDQLRGETQIYGGAGIQFTY